MPYLRLTLLASFQLLVDDQPVRQFRSSKEQALLAYLAVEASQPHSREKLAGLLWPDRPETTARRNLSQTLLNLRKTLGDHQADPPFFLVTSQTIQFNQVSDYSLDVTEFAALLSHTRQHQHEAIDRCTACAAALQTTAALYQGRFLDGFSLPDSEEFEAWCLLKQEWLQRQMLEALEYLASYSEWQQDYRTACSWAWRQREIDPLQEPAYRRLMRVLWLDGQRSQAIQQYEQCRDLLLAELGVAPDAETLALYEQIKQDNLPLKSHPIQKLVQVQLPVPTTPFIGREEQLQQLSSLLLEKPYRLVTLVGQGGIGKTRLALAAAAHLIDQFAQGACFVPLAGVRPPTHQPVTALHHILATAIAEALGLIFTGSEDPERQLFAFLQQKRMLLVLDNFEHLVEGANFVAQLLQYAPQIHLLITSREILSLQAEYAFPLTGLPVPKNLPDADQYASVQLFVERAERTPMGLGNQSDNMPHIVDICRLVDGNPLAIELAAAWIRVMPCQEIAQEIRRSLAFLESTLRELPERHRSMRAVFEHSWQLLTARQQELLCQLAIFQGGFERKAQREITQARLQDLTALLDKSLVQQQPSGRYEIHELIRQFAEHHLHQLTSQLPLVYKRHSDYYLNLVQQYGQILGGPQAAPALNTLKRELDNIRQAWDWAVRQSNMAAITQSVTGITRFYRRLGLYGEGAELIAAALQSLYASGTDQTEQTVLLGNLLNRQATFLNALGQYAAASAAAQEAIQAASRAANPMLKVIGQLRWGEALWYQGNVEAAMPHLQEAWLQSQTLGLPELEADCLLALGSAVLRLGDSLQAQQHYEQALRITQIAQDNYRESQAYKNLGAAARNQGILAQAQGYYEQSLRLAHEIGDRQSEGAVRNSLGDLLLSQGLYLEAQTQYGQGLALAREIGDRRLESIILTNLGRIYRDLGLYEEAQPYFDQTIPINEILQFKRGHSWVLCCIALGQIQQAQYDLARPKSAEAYHIFASLGDRLGMAHSLTYLGHALTGLGYEEEAAAAYNQAIALRQEMGQHPLTIEPRAGLARLALQQNEVVQAQQVVSQIMPYLIANQLAGVEEPLRVYYTCYVILKTVGDVQAAALAQQMITQLQQRAARIHDERLRDAFLNNVTTHRQIIREIGSIYQD